MSEILMGTAFVLFSPEKAPAFTFFIDATSLHHCPPSLSSNHSTSSSLPSPNSSAASGSIHTSTLVPLTCIRSGVRGQKVASMTRGGETKSPQSEFCHYYKISRSGIYLSVLVMEAGRNTHFNNSLL